MRGDSVLFGGCDRFGSVRGVASGVRQEREEKMRGSLEWLAGWPVPSCLVVSLKVGVWCRDQYHFMGGGASYALLVKIFPTGQLIAWACEGADDSEVEWKEKP